MAASRRRHDRLGAARLRGGRNGETRTEWADVERQLSGFEPRLRSVESFRNSRRRIARGRQGVGAAPLACYLGPSAGVDDRRLWRGLAGRETTGHEASDYSRERHGIRRTAATLAKLRSVGGGPLFHKFGRSVICGAGDLDAWAGKVKSGPLAFTSEGR
jgi:hypothetical protein